MADTLPVSDLYPGVVFMYYAYGGKVPIEVVEINPHVKDSSILFVHGRRRDGDFSDGHYVTVELNRNDEVQRTEPW